jgi:hypothetical protein
MRAAVEVCTIALLLSCGKSGGSERFQKLAQRANPVIEKLRTTVGIVLDPKSETKAVDKACVEAIDTATALGGAGFKDGFQLPKSRSDMPEPLGVEDVLYAFSMQRDVMCREDEGDGSRDATCRKWCVEMFSAMADAVERAKEAAGREGVVLQTLRP